MRANRPAPPAPVREDDADRDSPQVEARERAIGLLARREHSRQELGRKLRQRGYEPVVVEPVLDALEDERLLSDERFAEEFVHARRRRGQGPLKIRSELAARGVDDGIAEALLRDDEQDYLAQARALREKRFGIEAPQDFRDRARQSRYLANRGFTPEQIRRVMGEGDD